MDGATSYRLLEIGKWAGILNRQFENFVKREMKTWNVNLTEFFFLMGGGMEEQIANAQLFAESLCIDKGTVTKVIKALECKGFVRRLKTPEALPNGMVRHAELTARGLQAQRAGLKIMQIWSEIVLKDLSPEECEVMADLQRKMAKNVLSVTSPSVIKTGEMP